MSGENQQARPNSGEGWPKPLATGRLVLADGMVVQGVGFGHPGVSDGEVCFNTAMTGYQEILTDPSYAGQIVTFTFPHIGNVGVNEEDVETVNMAAAPGVGGVVVHARVTEPSNYRAERSFDAWLKARRIVGLSGVDTRALTTLIRERGMPNGVIAHAPDGVFDIPALVERARALPAMEGRDLVPLVTGPQRYGWEESRWAWPGGFGAAPRARFHVVALDYGAKRNILRLLVERGCRVTVLPPTASAEEVLAQKPDGVFLANGPGDPAATGLYAVPTIRAVLDAKVPTFGICLGHQMLGLAIGATTVKMRQGHHGANHPVKEHDTGKVEIVSMNHGFAIDRDSLPPTAVETHVSLFDGSNCGLKLNDRPAFSVQHHPEASPGPQDSHYLFDRFVAMMEAARERATA